MKNTTYNKNKLVTVSYKNSTTFLNTTRKILNIDTNDFEKMSYEELCKVNGELKTIKKMLSYELYLKKIKLNKIHPTMKKYVKYDKDGNFKCSVTGRYIIPNKEVIKNKTI